MEQPVLCMALLRNHPFPPSLRLGKLAHSAEKMDEHVPVRLIDDSKVACEARIQRPHCLVRSRIPSTTSRG